VRLLGLRRLLRVGLAGARIDGALRALGRGRGLWFLPVAFDDGGGACPAGRRVAHLERHRMLLTFLSSNSFVGEGERLLVLTRREARDQLLRPAARA